MPIVFFAFRIMVGIGIVLLATAVTGAVLRWRGRLFTTRWFHLVCMGVVPLGFMAVLAGWTVTEVGRQPFVVYGQLLTADAASPVASGAVATSLAIFVALYATLLLAFLWYGWRVVIRGPSDDAELHHPDAIPARHRPGRPGAAGRCAGASHPCRRASARGVALMILPLLFALVAATGVAAYVLFDGFDLGIGMLFLFAPREQDRDVMMDSIAPFWDGNETWLVLGGTLLLAAFPAGYYVLLPAFYLPVMLMLFALISRGVAFEFRFQATRFPARVGLYVCRWVRVGRPITRADPRRLHQRHPDAQRHLCRGRLRLAYSAGLGVRGGAGRGLHVARSRLADPQGQRCHPGVRARGRPCVADPDACGDVGRQSVDRGDAAGGVGTLVRLALGAAPGFLPLGAAVTGVLIWRSLWSPRDWIVFRLAVVLFLLGFGGLAVSLFPYVVPRQVTIWDGAADTMSLRFLGVGMAIILPMILGYLWFCTGYSGARRSGMTRMEPGRRPPHRPSCPGAPARLPPTCI